MFGASFARMATDRGKKVLVVEKRGHLGGMCYTEIREGVVFHVYGPHVFHTSVPWIWKFVQRFADFKPYTVRIKTVSQGRYYTLPFCLGLFHELWGTKTPEEARRKLKSVRIPMDNPVSVEDWALSQLGPEIYEKFVHPYTFKQWGREPADLPAAILQRLPIRYTWDDNYFADRWQAVPVGGYTPMFDKMLEGIEVRLNTDFLDDKKAFERLGQVVYSGRLDAYHKFNRGPLAFRSCRLETQVFPGDYQGVADLRWADLDLPYTRTTEHKYWENPGAKQSPVTWEFPFEAGPQDTPFYPVQTDENQVLAETYKNATDRAIVGGRCGSYRYFDMCEVIAQAASILDKL